MSRDVETASKVPEVTALFWALKIAATTLGETSGDAVSISMHLGYLVGTGIFAVFFAIVAATQILSARFHPLLYGPRSSRRPRSERRRPTWWTARSG